MCEVAAQKEPILAALFREYSMVTEHEGFQESQGST